MRKVEGHAAKVLEDIIQDKDPIFEIKGKQYKVVAISEDIDESTVVEDVQNDPGLRQRLLQAKKDIEEGNYYSSEEMREMIRSGKI